MGRPRKNIESVLPISSESQETSIEVAEDTSTSEVCQARHRYQDQIDFWRRDYQGFLPNVDYIFDENQRINWRKMIPTKYLVPNKDKFPAGTDLKSLNVEELDDSKLLVLLNGLRYISRIRGIRAVKQRICNSSPEYVSATCEIEFIRNHEDGELTFVGEADAHPYNTHSFAKNYLTAIAGNRAFCRAVRNGLGIEVLAFDEVGPTNQENPNHSKADAPPIANKAYEKLAKLLISADVTFDQLRNKLQQIGMFSAEQVATINTIEQIPSDKILEVIELTQKRIEERKKK